MSRKTQPVWWEKTVEYSYVATMLSQGLLKLTPLAGKHELAGDLVVWCPKGFILIEFKRNHDSLGSERKKFKNYEDARSDLEKDSAHHFLIYGEMGKSGWELIAKPYFSPDGDDVYAVKTLLDKGALRTAFTNYLNTFVSHKIVRKKGGDDKGDDNGPGGGPDNDPNDDGPPPDYSLVAGIDNEGKIVLCMTVDDFLMRANGPSHGGGFGRPTSPGPDTDGTGITLPDEPFESAISKTEALKAKAANKKELVPH